jgi:hypothetical protein
VVAEASAYVEAIAAGDHEVEEEEGRILAFCLGNKVCGCMEDLGRKAGRFQMMLHQTGNIRLVFKHKN